MKMTLKHLAIRQVAITCWFCMILGLHDGSNPLFSLDTTTEIKIVKKNTIKTHSLTFFFNFYLIFFLVDSLALCDL